MDIIGFISENWTVIGSSTILSILTKELLDTWIKKDQMIFQSDLNKNLEKLKSDLKKENDTELSKLNLELEKLRAQLNFTNNRLQVAYSGVLEEHVNTLKTLYSLVLDLEAEIHRRNSKQNLIRQPLQIYEEFRNLYHLKGIFLPSSLDEKISEVMGSSFVVSIANDLERAEQAARAGEEEEANKLSQLAMDRIGSLQKIRNEFRNEIRKLLAIDS